MEMVILGWVSDHNNPLWRRSFKILLTWLKAYPVSWLISKPLNGKSHLFDTFYTLDYDYLILGISLLTLQFKICSIITFRIGSYNLMLIN